MTVGAPIVFGDFAVPDAIEVAETFVNTAVSGSFGQGSTGSWTLANVTMPWAGCLSTKLTISGYWTNNGIAYLNLSPYGTGPTSWWFGAVQDHNVYGANWVHSPYLGYWQDLGKGAVISVGVTANVPLASSPFEASGIAGSIRMWRV